MFRQLLTPVGTPQHAEKNQHRHDRQDRDQKRKPQVVWRSTRSQGSLEALRLSPEMRPRKPAAKISPPIGCSVLRRSTTPFNLAKERSHESKLLLAAR